MTVKTVRREKSENAKNICVKKNLNSTSIMHDDRAYFGFVKQNLIFFFFYRRPY